MTDPHISQLAFALRTAFERDAVCAFLAGNRSSASARALESLVRQPSITCGQAITAFVQSRPSESARTACIEALEAVPVVRLTLAFVPRDEAVSRWHRAIAKNMSGPFVLEIVRDEDIAGGAVLEIKGRVVEETMGKQMGNSNNK